MGNKPQFSRKLGSAPFHRANLKIWLYLGLTVLKKLCFVHLVGLLFNSLKWAEKQQRKIGVDGIQWRKQSVKDLRTWQEELLPNVWRLLLSHALHSMVALAWFFFHFHIPNTAFPALHSWAGPTSIGHPDITLWLRWSCLKNMTHPKGTRGLS